MQEEFCFATLMSAVGGKESVLCNTVLEREAQKCCNMCLEWERRYGVLESEIQKKNSEFELLQGRFGALKGEKLSIEDNLRILKKKNEELEEKMTQIENGSKVVNEGVKGMERIVDLTGEMDEEDRVFQLMIENKVLECEKKKAESEIDDWKVKSKELESKIFELEETLLSRGKEPSLTGTPLNLIGTRFKQSTYVEGGKTDIPSGPQVKYRKRVRKQLAFGEEEEEEESPKKKIAPSTPAVAKPASICVIDISDSDGEKHSIPNNEFTFENNLKSSLLDQNDEEDTAYVLTPRRKRASNIITSDSESSDEDNLPISTLKTKRLPESHTDSHLNNSSPSTSVSRRRIVTLRNSRECTNEDVEDDTEGESLGGFIVDTTSSGVSESDDDVSLGESEDSVDMDYKEVISRIRRNRVDKLKWEFEADMLADFGKDPELCMKALCALYRQQTSEEKSTKVTLYSNQRGFSQCDAYRGSALAEFLTDGDPTGDVVKSVDELREYNPKGVELCRNLATRYSKQLFAIYKNKEDPFFLPP